MSAAPAPIVTLPNPKYARLPTEIQLEETVKHLRDHGFEVTVVPTIEDAQAEVVSRIPSGAEVLDAASRTLEEAGILGALAARSDVTFLKRRLYALDRATQMAEFRRISQAPDVVIGSVQAVTESGEVLAASATGVQIGPYSWGAGRVIWIVGAQKIVPNFAEGLDRIERYCLPLEDVRARKVYGNGSSINRILIFRREHEPGRTTMILVKQRLGF